MIPLPMCRFTAQSYLMFATSDKGRRDVDLSLLALYFILDYTTTRIKDFRDHKNARQSQMHLQIVPFLYCIFLNFKVVLFFSLSCCLLCPISKKL